VIERLLGNPLQRDKFIRLAKGEIDFLGHHDHSRADQLKRLDAILAQPATLPEREVLRATLELRTADWREVLRGKHVQQARLVLQHLLELPIRIMNEPKPKLGDAHASWRATRGNTKSGVPTGIRTRVSALKGPRPRPLDDGDPEEHW
jgi:hypothetical protein